MSTPPSSQPIPVPARAEPDFDDFGGSDDSDDGITHYAPAAWQCGGTLRVTDPCYTKGEGAIGIAGTQPALPGPWRSCARNTGGTVAHLLTWAAASRTPDPDTDGWEEAPFNAAVDSGQCGVFDDARYPAGPVGEYEDEDSFYGKACVATDNRQNFGLVDDIGVVSRSGFGDGLYLVYLRRVPEGDVDAVYVKFFDENDGEDDDEAPGEDDDEAPGEDDDENEAPAEDLPPRR